MPRGQDQIHARRLALAAATDLQADDSAVVRSQGRRDGLTHRTHQLRSLRYGEQGIPERNRQRQNQQEGQPGLPDHRVTHTTPIETGPGGERGDAKRDGNKVGGEQQQCSTSDGPLRGRLTIAHYRHRRHQGGRDGDSDNGATTAVDHAVATGQT